VYGLYYYSSVLYIVYKLKNVFCFVVWLGIETKSFSAFHVRNGLLIRKQTADKDDHK